jgi:hypothetical protein
MINGKTAMVAVDFVAPPGIHTLYLLEQCGGYYLYGVGSCSCKRPDFKFKNTVSLKGILTVATVNKETASQEVSFTGQIQSMVPPGDAGFLWIRKDDKKNSSIL